MNTTFKMSLLCLASACLFFILLICCIDFRDLHLRDLRQSILILLLLVFLAGTIITGISTLYLSISRRTFQYCLFPLIIFLIIFWNVGLYKRIRPPFHKRPPKANDTLKHIHILLMMYANDWNSFPKVTPEGGNGVRDLYPLYATGLLEKQNLKLLQPPGTKMKRFSDEPIIYEFDQNHIGFSYNSTAIPDDPNNPPLMADQGVSSGSLQLETNDNGLKARDTNGVIVLFDSGRIEFIPADKNGRLSTNKLSQADWSLLKDNP